jgi:hypothetical protein
MELIGCGMTWANLLRDEVKARLNRRVMMREIAKPEGLEFVALSVVVALH